MSMTREEAIDILQHKICFDSRYPVKAREMWRDAVKMAAAALRPVGREQVDVVIKSLKLRLENDEENGVVYIPKFAVEKMIERLEAIENG